MFTVERTSNNFHFFIDPRVEAGKNTSTVIPASRKRRQKGNPVVSDETVMHAWPLTDLTTNYRLVLVREGTPRRRAKQLNGERKTWLTVSRKVISTSTSNVYPRVEAGKNTSTIIPASRKRWWKGNRTSPRWDSASWPKRRLMRTYFWISLFTSYRITAN
jgi:hypothetical protein